MLYSIGYSTAQDRAALDSTRHGDKGRQGEGLGAGGGRDVEVALVAKQGNTLCTHPPSPSPLSPYIYSNTVRFRSTESTRDAGEERKEVFEKSPPA